MAEVDATRDHLDLICRLYIDTIKKRRMVPAGMTEEQLEARVKSAEADLHAAAYRHGFALERAEDGST